MDFEHGQYLRFIPFMHSRPLHSTFSIMFFDIVIMSQYTRQLDTPATHIIELTVCIASVFDSAIHNILALHYNFDLWT